MPTALGCRDLRRVAAVQTVANVVAFATLSISLIIRKVLESGFLPAWLKGLRFYNIKDYYPANLTMGKLKNSLHPGTRRLLMVGGERI
jgi:hypothetical protein